MIERNLGNAERLIRLFLGIAFAYWTLSQPHLRVTEWFVGLVALMLILNGVFSRCYLWYVLDLDTRPKCEV
ncbi:DUF2892 domain-containing protein [Haliea sp. E17]|uniref:YgaP family membrane protein n=1 Tax=Haliea sp. E17 TaxID=3401576 RepID=UPI003AAE4E88